MNKPGSFWGGVLLVVAAIWILNGSGTINVLPPQTYDEVYFILLDESSEPSAEIAILVNSDKWLDLSGKGVTARRYDVTLDEKKPEVEKYVKELGAVKPPAILVIDKKTNRSVGVEANPSLDRLDGIVKKYTGK